MLYLHCYNANYYAYYIACIQCKLLDFSTMKYMVGHPRICLVAELGGHI